MNKAAMRVASSRMGRHTHDGEGYYVLYRPVHDYCDVVRLRRAREETVPAMFDCYEYDEKGAEIPAGLVTSMGHFEQSWWWFRLTELELLTVLG
jgi:hypothetical protein